MTHRARLGLRKRPGIAVVLVLAILAITLTISYAVLRTQTTSMLVASNHARVDDARIAAMSGISAGLRKIHTSSWAGVGTQITGTIGNGSSYVVDFIAGDTSLIASDPNYAQLPYRVTLRSKGMSASSDGSASITEHVIQVVVQLVPRQLQSTPSQWSRVQGYTLFQWQDQALTFELPSQVAGPVHSQGTLSFMPSLPAGMRNPFAGYIDEVAIYNKVLSEIEIAAIYAAATAGDPTSLYTSHGPLAYWKLNEASNAVTAADSAGAHPALYISSKPGQSDRPFTSAVSSTLFDGMNDHIDCDKFVISGNNLTVLAWVKPSTLTSDMRIISQALGDSDAEQYWKMSIEQSGTIYRALFAVRSGGGSYSECMMNSGALSANVWYFLAGTYDGSQIKLYVNGVLARNNGQTGELMTNSDAFITIGDVPPGSPRVRLLRDYYQMQQNNIADHRPLAQSWSAPSGKVSSTASNFLQDDLKLTLNSVSVDTTAPATFPTTLSTYQIFPGGPIYTIPTTANELRETQLLANPVTNPLGIFKCTGDLRIRDHVTIKGTILVLGTGSDITVDDDSVTWTPVDLSALSDESLARQLPIAIVPSCFIVAEGCTSVNITGQIVAGDVFQLGLSDDPTDVRILGSCVTGKMQLNADTRWSTSASTWKSYLQSFLEQRGTGVAYFPQWLASAQSIQTSPRVSIKPENSNRIYHWPTFTATIFQPHASDPGMRWKVVSWDDGA